MVRRGHPCGGVRPGTAGHGGLRPRGNYPSPAVPSAGCTPPTPPSPPTPTPWAASTTVPATVDRTSRDLPRNFAALPTVSFLIPNMCDDMHDCPVTAGDSWAARTLPDYVRWA